MLATVPNESGGAAGYLSSLPERLRNYVTANPHVVIAASIPALFLSLCLMLWGGKAGIHERAAVDYQVYRWAVHTWLSGGDIINDAPTTSIGRVLPWVYPPFALLPLLPLSLIAFIPGLLLLFAIDLATVGTVCYLVVRRMWPDVGRHGAAAVAAALLPLALFLEPVYACFGLGQVNIALMGLVAVDCLTRQPRWPRGLLVGIAAAIKLTPAAFLLFFLVRRDFRAALVTTVTAVSCTGIGFLLNFDASVDYWFGRGPAHGVSGSTFHTNQSILGGLARLGLPAPVQTGTWLLASAALVVVAAYIIRHVDVPLAVSTNGLLALLVSPTSWSDHWVWVVPGLLLMYGYAAAGRSIGWLLAAVVTTLTAMDASFRKVPNGGPGSWSAWQHFVGNPFLLLGLALMLLLAREVSRRRRWTDQDDLAVPDHYSTAPSL